MVLFHFNDNIGYTRKYEEFIKWVKEDLEYLPSGYLVKEFYKDTSFDMQEHYIVSLTLKVG